MGQRKVAVGTMARIWTLVQAAGFIVSLLCLVAGIGFILWQYVRARAFLPIGIGVGVMALAGVLLYLRARIGYWEEMRRWRRESGQCLSCGYDLRASPERCPECGRPARAAARLRK